MDYVNGDILRQLRERLGLSKYALVNYIATTEKTIRKNERDGTSNMSYVEALLQLVERASAGDQSIVNGPRGAPVKRWHLYVPRRFRAGGGMGLSELRDYSRATYRLWRLGNADHLKWIDAPPIGPSIGWLVRTKRDGDYHKELFQLHMRNAESDERTSLTLQFDEWQNAKWTVETLWK